MAIKQEKNPTVELSKEEQKALASLEAANKEVVASTKDKNTETEACEAEIENHNKKIEEAKKEVSDLAERRRLRMGK